MVAAVTNANTAFFMSEAFPVFFLKLQPVAGLKFPASALCKRSAVKFNVDERVWLERSADARLLGTTLDVQPLLDHHQPGRDHRAVPRRQPLRRQPATDAWRVSRLSGTGDSQHPTRDES
jgi:hypothetical protein